MPSEQLRFYQLDVFTTTPYKGNPLAIVHLPPGRDLEPEQKLKIAREFNLSETVFLHAIEGDQAKIDIYTTTEELPFAGHPTIGSGWHLLNDVRPGITLLTKAGAIPVAPLPSSGVGVVVPQAESSLESPSISKYIRHTPTQRSRKTRRV